MSPTMREEIWTLDKWRKSNLILIKWKISSSPFQTWAEVLSSVGLKAEKSDRCIYTFDKFINCLQKNYFNLKADYPWIPVRNICTKCICCITHLYYKRLLSYPSVVNSNKLVPLLPKKKSFNNSADSVLYMHKMFRGPPGHDFYKSISDHFVILLLLCL